MPDILGNFLGGGRTEMLVRLYPELPEKIPKPFDPCVARSICSADDGYRPPARCTLLMTSPGPQRTAGQLRGRSGGKQGGRSAGFFRELIGRGKNRVDCPITPRSPQKIPNPSGRALLRASTAQIMVVAPARVHFVDDITWISENCGPIKGKE